MVDLAGMEEKTIEGDGFRLRPWRAEDARWLLRHANDAQVVRGLSERFPHPYRREDAWRFLAGEVVDLTDPVFAIDIDGRACGGIGAHPRQGERSGSAELGYWLGRRYWGQGLMSRIVSAYVPWVMDQLQLHRMQANVLDINPASARVLLKNGFQEEGLLRQAIRKDGQLHDLRVFSRLRAQTTH
ncbi:GNAT family N-acetyltransferase [Pseudoxanthomonas beigongshangi]